MNKKNSSDELNSISDAMEEFIRVTEAEEETDEAEAEFSSEKVEYKPVTVENLASEFKKTMKQLDKSISVQEVNSFLKDIVIKKESLFNKDVSEAMSDTTPEQQQVIMKKLEEWTAPEEIAELNAKAFISWMNNQENSEDD